MFGRFWRRTSVAEAPRRTSVAEAPRRTGQWFTQWRCRLCDAKFSAKTTGPHHVNSDVVSRHHCGRSRLGVAYLLGSYFVLDDETTNPITSK